MILSLLVALSALAADGEDYDGTRPMWGFQEEVAVAEVEPPPPPPAIRKNEDGIWEITVHGRSDLESRQDAAARKMQRLGWRAKRRGDDLVFKPPRRWMPRVEMTGDGRLILGERAASFEGVEVGDPGFERSNLHLPPGERLHDDFPGIGTGPSPAAGASFLIGQKRVTQGVYRRVIEAITPELTAYRQALWALALQDQVNALPQRLDALWFDGTPLEGGPSLATTRERRAAVLDYWATRADTPEGHVVSQTIETWLSEVVQASEDPVTWREQAAANARRNDRRLALVEEDRW